MAEQPAGEAQPQVVEDAEALAIAGAQCLLGWIAEDQHDEGICQLALSGGRTPRAMYDRLGQGSLAETVDVDRIEFYYGDERVVPHDDPHSNHLLAREHLYEPLAIKPGQVFRMEVERADGAQRYAAVLPEQLDVLLLGMGLDGHIASLFPGSDALEEEDRRVVRVMGPEPPRQRLTITPPVIAAARRVLVLVTGGAKAEAVARALHGAWDPLATPAQLARHGTWILDRAAATGL